MRLMISPSSATGDVERKKFAKRSLECSSFLAGIEFGDAPSHSGTLGYESLLYTR